ncbi:MAG: hypothetical protein R3F60_19260 [bacterium]
MIISNPANGRAVVAAAGYETGPGANTAVGGVAEEIHDYLGTSHRDRLTLGFAEDQDLPLGPIDCPRRHKIFVFFRSCRIRYDAASLGGSP